MTTTAIKTQKSVNSQFFDGTRVACPIYVGVVPATAKAILSALRAKAGTGASAVATPGGISVVNNTQTQEERAIVSRLRVDLHTLRSLLLGSDTRGLSLDLAMRVQAEVADTIQFVSEEQIREAFEQSLKHYRNYYNAT